MSSRSVELLLLRHGHAGDPMTWDGDDAERPLSGRGRKQAKRLAAFLEATGIRPDVIVTSPKLRARQTAEPVATALRLRVRVDDRLAGGLDLDGVDALLAETGDPDRPMLVGHDPDFTDIASELVGVEVPLAKGALVRIDGPRPLIPGSGTLRWLVPPDLLKPER